MTATIIVAAVVITASSLVLSRASQAARRLETASELSEAAFERIAIRSNWLLLHEEGIARQWRASHQRVIRLLDDAGREFGDGAHQSRINALRDYQPSVGESFARLEANWQALQSGAIDTATVKRVEDQTLGEMTAKAQEVADFSTELTNDSRQELSSAMRLGVILPMVLVALLALLVVADTVVISVWVLRGMDSIQEGTKRVAEGDLETRIEVRGGNEIAGVADSFNKMTERVKSKGEILEGFNLVFRAGLTGESEEDIARACLSVAERISEARLGFLGLVNERGLLDTKSLSEPGWAECTMPETQAVRMINDMELTSFWGRVIKMGSPQLVNDPSSDPDATGTPVGHPEIQSFLGVPLRRGEETVGVIALANKEGGFEAEDIQDLDALGTAFMQALGRHRAEAELRLRRDVLEEQVMERTAELQEAMAELERSNAELQQFAYVASHDLQEPLRMIASYVQLLADRYSGRLDDDADEFIAYAVDGADRMQTLISDLLALSRVQTGREEMKPTDANLALGKARANLALPIEESGAVVTSDALPSVTADETNLTQLFQNLISNSIKFRGTAPPGIHVSADLEGGEWVFSVKDNGIGFDPRHSERIFEIFQRLNPRGAYQGTGIGLAIGRKIVEQHGGRIWAESEPGKGATFYFTIPVGNELG
jgi:signal transduction histidine kinase/HAMP domain-containing protein